LATPQRKGDSSISRPDFQGKFLATLVYGRSNYSCVQDSLISVPSPRRSALRKAIPAATTSCTATPTDLNNVICCASSRPVLVPATISPTSAQM